MKYVIKTAQEQAKDIGELDLYQRIDRYVYFHNLQLINKLKGVTEYPQVNEADRIFSSIRYAELQVEPIEGIFDVEHLCKIHEYLYQDIYYFAGKFRDVDMQLDRNTNFTWVQSLNREATRIFDKLKNDNFLKGLSKADFCDKLALFMNELNKLHPFREGNGRSKRMFVGQLAKNAGWELDWSAVSAEDWKQSDIDAFASERDFGKPDTTFLKRNLGKAVTLIKFKT